jgi:hypothetical protein
VQRILTWINFIHPSFDCDPGGVDNDLGPATRAARRKFREQFNRSFKGTLALEGEQNVADWVAYFQVFDHVLAGWLGSTGQELDAARAALRFADEPVIGCGEAFPRPGTEGQLSTETNRRVDILFFDELELPALDAEPAGSGIYSKTTSPVAIEPQFALATSSVQFSPPVLCALGNVFASVARSDGRPLPFARELQFGGLKVSDDVQRDSQGALVFVPPGGELEAASELIFVREQLEFEIEVSVSTTSDPVGMLESLFDQLEVARQFAQTHADHLATLGAAESARRSAYTNILEFAHRRFAEVIEKIGAGVPAERQTEFGERMQALNDEHASAADGFFT